MSNSPVRQPGRPPGTARSWRGRVTAVLAVVLAATTLPALATSTSASAAPAPSGPWHRVDGKPAASKNGRDATIDADRFAAYTLDRAGLKATLDRAPQERDRAQRQQRQVVSLPAPDGRLERFELVESPVMEAGLAAAHPEITTYAGRGLDDPTATIRADLTPLGFHASVRSAAGAWYIDPYYHLD